MIADPSTSVSMVPPVPVDSFGCPSSRMHKDQQLSGGSVKFFRKRTYEQRLGHVATPATNRGFLLGVSTQGAHSRRIFHANHSSHHEFDADSIYIRNFSDAYRADLHGQFDFMLMEISPSSFGRMAEEIDGTHVRNLTCTPGHKDPVLANLMRALVPALEKPETTSLLFVDQVAVAMGTYLIQQYGDRQVPVRARNRTLSRAQEALAKELLRSRLDGNILISEVADACNLSRSYFIRAFRETTGHTPHRWLLTQRVERARDLLQDTKMPLAEIAIVCGFSDQSHFTRIFASVIGTSPGNWRRNLV